jgi:hypothetical protein
MNQAEKLLNRVLVEVASRTSAQEITRLSWKLTLFLLILKGPPPDFVSESNNILYK